MRIRELAWLLALGIACFGRQPPPPGPPPQRAFARSPQAQGQPFTCPSCNLKGLDLSGSDFTNANLTDADLTGANLAGAILRGASLERANLTDVNLTSAHLEDSNQGSTDLSSANLSGVVLIGATLAGADMEYTDLSGVNFGGLDVSTVKFGPEVKTGTHKGVQTSFHGATIRSDFKPVGVNLTGVRRVTLKTMTPRRKGLGVVPTVTCSSSDLSPLTSVVYVSSAGTDSVGCGTTHANACKTISQGIQNCAAAGCGVLVDFGQYPQTATLAVRNGVSVYGGCVASTPGNYYSLITAPAGGASAVSAQSVGTATTWQNFKISGSSATGTNGAPSVAASVTGSSALSFVNCDFYASTGRKALKARRQRRARVAERASARRVARCRPVLVQPAEQGPYSRRSRSIGGTESARRRAAQTVVMAMVGKRVRRTTGRVEANRVAETVPAPLVR